MRINRCLLIGALMLGLPTSAWAGSMKLLAPGVGWTATSHGLFWTEDEGGHWKEITPPGGKNGAIADVFFLDTRSGWALLRAGSKLVPGKSDAQPQFDLSSTTDAGTTWQTFHVTVPPQVIEPYSDGADVPDLTGQGKIAFADRLHGWMNLSSGNYRGTLLNTSDGGRSWKQAPGDRVKWASYIVPVTPEEGWMVAGGSSDELYVTRDGAKSFDDVSLVAPEEVSGVPPADSIAHLNQAVYGMPTFLDSKHGFIPATYHGSEGVRSATVLFATDDGGRTWKADRILKNLKHAPAWGITPSVVVNTSWIFATDSDHFPTLTNLKAGARVNSPIDSASSHPGHFVDQLSFVTPLRGWIIVGDGELLTTTDGAANWMDITPGDKRHLIEPPGGFAHRPPRAILADGTLVTIHEIKGPLPSRVGAIKMLAPGIGWAWTGHGLLWTEDGGKDWKDITPQITGDETLNNIFFLDRSKGWITINHERAASKEVQFEVATTSDAGSTWKRAKSTIRPKDYGISSTSALSGAAGRIAFADPLHGWLNVGFGGETPNSWSSFLLLTSDGGLTWSRAIDAPELSDSEMLLRTPKEGWLYGRDYDTNSRLYVTRDGAHHWHEVAPKPAGLRDSQVIGLPTFEDGQHGFLQVNGVGQKDRELRLTMVLLETTDGGRTWKPDRTVANLDDIARNQYLSSTVVGSEWIFDASVDHRPVLTRLGAGGRIDASSDAAESSARFKDIRQISFASSAQAWAIVGDGDLLSTTDGGTTWTDITPRPKR